MDGTSTVTPSTPVAPEWHAQSDYLKGDPDAAKSFMDYKTSDDQLKAHREAKKLLGQPVRLPKDHTKLTDEQKGEIAAFHRKMTGVPDSPEGYAFKLPEDAPIDEEAIDTFRKLAHERGMDPATAQEAVDIQLALVKRMNAHRDRVLQGMTDNNYKTFLNEDCQDDKALARLRMEQVKRYLQTFCVGKDGKLDPVMWEKYWIRKTYNDRMTELIDLRALHQAAQMGVGTGGAPGSYENAVMGGSKHYAEMRAKK